MPNYYIHSVLKGVLRTKSYSILNVLGLGFGLTACFLIGLFVWDELRYDKFIPAADRIFRLYNLRTVETGTEKFAYTPPAFATKLIEDRENVELALRVMEIQEQLLIQSDTRKAYERGGILADNTFFELFPLRLVYGNAHSVLDNPNAIVISDGTARLYFGAGNPVGREILLDDTPRRVSGVFVNDHKFHLKPNFIIPLVPKTYGKKIESWRWQEFYTYVKLRNRIDAMDVQGKFQDYVALNVQPMTKKWGFAYKPHFQKLADIHLHSAAFKQDIAIRGNASYVNALVAIGFFILAIACFNFVNLTAARSLQRTKETGIRRALGASRGQLIMQFMGEALILVFSGVLVAGFLTLILLPTLNAFTGKHIAVPDSVPFLLSFFVALLSILTISAGLYPALAHSGFRPVDALKGTLAETQKTPRILQGLVTIQFTISVFLVTCTLIVYQQVSYLHGNNLGFDKERVLFFSMKGKAMLARQCEFKVRLEGIKGVTSVSVGYGFPGDLLARDGIIVPNGQRQTRYSTTMLIADDDYIRTLGIEIVAGRNFAAACDTEEGFILNKAAVKMLGLGTPKESIGKELRWKKWEFAGTDSIKRGYVIGVVKDFNYKSLYDYIEPAVLQIYPPANEKIAIKLAPSADGETMKKIAQEWKKFSTQYPLQYRYMDAQFSGMYIAEDKLATLLTVFTGLAIFVACLGLFGLSGFAAQRRKKEIGIRKAVGASAVSITFLLSKDLLKLVLLSLIIALPMAWLFMEHWLDRFAYRISLGLGIFIFGGLIAVLVACVSIGIHALQAALGNSLKYIERE